MTSRHNAQLSIILEGLLDQIGDGLKSMKMQNLWGSATDPAKTPSCKSTYPADEHRYH